MKTKTNVLIRLIHKLCRILEADYMFLLNDTDVDVYIESFIAR